MAQRMARPQNTRKGWAKCYANTFALDSVPRVGRHLVVQGRRVRPEPRASRGQRHHRAAAGHLRRWKTSPMRSIDCGFPPCISPTDTPKPGRARYLFGALAACGVIALLSQHAASFPSYWGATSAPSRGRPRLPHPSRLLLQRALLSRNREKAQSATRTCSHLVQSLRHEPEVF